MSQNLVNQKQVKEQEDVVILVDENDNEIGVCGKLEAHEKALLHRAFSVFVFCRGPKNEPLVLLQRRHPEKYHCGNLWSNTCCSHPRPGESIIEAGERRLQEEMGIRQTLQSVGHFTYRSEFSNGLTEYEYDHILISEFREQDIVVNRQEVAQYRWTHSEAVMIEVNAHPDCYTPWFKPALKIAAMAYAGLDLSKY